MWKDAYLESRLMSADPLELVTILYEHGIRAVEEARMHLASGDVAHRAKAIAKAISIVSELHGSLDQSAGGEISANLAKLYEYMQYRLSEGNLHRKDQPLKEVEGLLRTLGEAWDAISARRESKHTVAEERYDTVVARMPFAMQAEVRGTTGHWSA